MISFEAALALIESCNLELVTQSLKTIDSLGLVLAQDLVAPINLPPFDNSAVDGFAVNSANLADALPFGDSIRAVGQKRRVLPKETTIKIMTGAPMPLLADAVVMKEDATIIDNRVYFHKPVVPKDNVRFMGEDVKKGQVVATAGSMITPQMIGLFYGLGIENIPVFKPPSISILCTGDELTKAGQPLEFGQVYYLVGPMLKAQCQTLGIASVSHQVVSDDQGAIIGAINSASEANIILVCGGMSKGEYDLVRLALSHCQVKEIFYQGAWRPGKPLYFGYKDKTFFFGLPGNPVAAYVCFHIFVKALILKAMRASFLNKPKDAILTADFHKKNGFTIFARGCVNENNQLEVLSGQGSHQIYHLSQANALGLMPAPAAIVKRGELVKYWAI